MPETVKRLRLFVASPGDVAEERERLAKVVDALRIHVAAAHGLDLELVRWETHVRPGAGADAQAVVNPQIGTYDLFIGILWNRFGTPTKRAESGTREEFDQAYARWQKDPSSLEIWVYFSQQPYTFTSAQELAQKGKVLAFQKELQEKKGLLVWTYKDPADFEEQVRGHLELFIPKYASSVRAAPTMEATLIGNGAIAQGAGAMAAGKGGVVAKTIQGPVMTGEHSQLIQADVVIQQAAAESPGPDWSLLQATYLRRLQVLANALPLAIIDPRAVERTRQQTMDLLAVYVALNTRTMVEVEEGKDRGREKRRQPERLLEPGREARPLTALEAVGRDRQMVLLGDPGSGKSTFANYLALCLAGARLEQAGQPSEIPGQNWLGQLPAWPHGPVLPLQVALRHLEKSQWCDGTAGGLWNFIAETLTTQNLGDFARYLRQELLNGHVLVILDGLDEVADPQKRECVRHAVAAFAATYNHPANRYLVTCRTYAYQDPQRQLPGFTAYTLAPFDAEQIDRFIACWYEEVRRLGWKSESEAQDLTGRLQAATRRPDLAPLAENPLQLTMMASLHYSWGRLPDDRVELYRQMVDLLLVRWQEAR
ncbi:MAG: NACHT domain-containing protein, partial [Acidobacteria bacterium]|nr:NACHT domain-containing protein [Acidobacteriota bacterium]